MCLNSKCDALWYFRYISCVSFFWFCLTSFGEKVKNLSDMLCMLVLLHVYCRLLEHGQHFGKSVGLVIERLRVRIPAGAAENFLLRSQLSVLTLIRCPFHTRVTAVTRKKTRVIVPKVQVAGYT